MYNKHKANQGITDAVETASDEFAALVDVLPPRQQLVMFDNLNELLGNPDSVDAFAAGTFAQNSGGQLAVASQPTVSTQDALDVLLNDPNGDPGIQAALRRILVPTDPQHMPVGRDGTPTEITSLKQDRDAQKTRADGAEQALTDERDPSNSGSLAEQLANATAIPALPVDMVAKTDVKAALDLIHAGWSSRKVGYWGHPDATVIKLPQKAHDIEQGVTKLKQLLS